MPDALPATGNVAPSELRAVRRELADASERHIRRVVAFIDALADRGQADELLEPLRPRLAHLRPPRPLRFERLLFLPLDPVIVPARDWRPGDPAIPRTALLPLARVVRGALGAEAAAVEAAIAGATTQDMVSIERAGARLWPAAAELLAAATPPDDWAACGLQTSLFAAIARAVAAVFTRRAALEALVADTVSGLLAEPEAAVAAFIEGIVDEPPDSQSVILALMLSRLPRADALLRGLDRAARGDAARAVLKMAADRATEAVLDALAAEKGIERQIAALSLAGAGEEIRRLVALLAELDQRAGDPRRRQRLSAVRQRLDQGCRTRFALAVRDDVLAPLQAGEVDGRTQSRLEAAVRALRAMDIEARQVGGADVYDDLLRQAAGAVRAVCGAGTLTRMRAARLVEILSGSEAAMALLEGGEAAA